MCFWFVREFMVVWFINNIGFEFYSVSMWR